MDRRILPFSITINGIWIGILVNVILEWPSTFASKWLEYAGLGGLSPRWVALVASLAGAVICGGFLWLVGAGVTRVMGVSGRASGPAHHHDWFRARRCHWRGFYSDQRKRKTL
jgi:hypothetical protein